MRPLAFISYIFAISCSPSTTTATTATAWWTITCSRFLLIILSTAARTRTYI